MIRAASWLMPAGVVVIVVGIGLAHARWAEPAYTLGGSRLTWGLAYAMSLSVAGYALGLPDVLDRARQVAAASLGAVLLGATVISLAQLLLGVALLPRFVVFGSMPIVALWLMGAHLMARSDRRRAQTRDRLLLVGEGEDVEGVATALGASPERPAEIVGSMTAEEARGCARSSQPLVSLARETGATVVVLDRTAQCDSSIVDQVALLHESGVRVRTLSLFYEYWLGRLPIGELERISLMFDIGEIHRNRFARRKRLIDVAAASSCIPLLLIAIPFVWVGNRLGNRGPLLFRQARIGKGGVPFLILKFRTMIHSDSDLGAWAGVDDSRITRFGGFLRRSHLDELPQILNVLRGELSMVGPRPEQPHYVEQLSEKLPFYRLRHLVQPGLTGWAQTNQGYAASSKDAIEKLQYEFWYLRHQRLAVDLRILFRTLRSVAGSDGR